MTNKQTNISTVKYDERRHLNDVIEMNALSRVCRCAALSYSRTMHTVERDFKFETKFIPSNTFQINIANNVVYTAFNWSFVNANDFPFFRRYFLSLSHLELFVSWLKFAIFKIQNHFRSLCAPCHACTVCNKIVRLHILHKRIAHHMHKCRSYTFTYNKKKMHAMHHTSADIFIKWIDSPFLFFHFAYCFLFLYGVRLIWSHARHALYLKKCNRLNNSNKCCGW